MMTLEEMWESLRQDPEIKATMEEVDKSYKLFKKIENLIVADLEAKLDEKTRVAEGYSELFDKKQHENYEQFCEIQQLKQQLAEKEKEIEELKQTKLLDDLHDATLTLLIGDKTRADLWALVEEHAMRELVLEKRIEQEKNQTAIAELEKVKEYYISSVQWTRHKGMSILEFIDQQIKELRGE